MAKSLLKYFSVLYVLINVIQISLSLLFFKYKTPKEERIL